MASFPSQIKLSFSDFRQILHDKAQFDESQIKYLVGFWRSELERMGVLKYVNTLVYRKIFGLDSLIFF